MSQNGYENMQPIQRHRRSERAKQNMQSAQSAAPEKKQVYPNVQQPRQTSSRQAWEQDDWQQGAHPGRQGYMPVQQPKAAMNPPSQSRPAQQRPVQPVPPSQNAGWQSQTRPGTYRTPQQAYGYQDQRSGGGYAAGYAPQQPRQNYQPPAYTNRQGYYQPQGQWQGGESGTGNHSAFGGNGGGQPPQKKTRALLRNILLIVLCIGILAGAAVFAKGTMERKELEEYVASYNNVFCEGVYVDGIHLGGMTAEQAMAAVRAQAQQRNDAWSVRLTYQGQLVTEITASDLNMKVDVTSVLNEAWKQGHTGDTDARKAAMDQLKTEPYEGYTAMPSSDTSIIDTTLTNIRNQVYRAPQDAQILSFDPEKTTDHFTFQDEVAGRYLDTAPVKEKIYQMVSTLESGSIELEPTILQPSVTVADLKKTVALRGSAYTKISTTSTENRNNNIVRSCQLISGTIIQPGEKFSFNGVVGERTVANGFYTAIEYANGEHVEGIGGGVCQTSSTVYLAAVYAGMEIVNREPHSDAVGYTSYGMDATVYWQYGRKIDFVFRNNTDSPIYMVAKVQSDPDNRKRLICKVEIYGADMGNVTYGMETATVEVLQPGEDIIVKDKKAQYVTYTDEQYVEREASEGYVVDSYRIKYVDGNAVERTKLYTDTYAAKAKRIYVGTKTRPAE